MMDQAEEVAKEMLEDSTHLVESVKQEPPWSMTEESPDQPSAVYSTVQPMSDSTSGSPLSVNTSHVCLHCSAPFVLVSSLELHLASFHGDPLPFPQWTEAPASSALHGADNKNFDEKQEPPLSLKEESPDQPSAVYSTAEPLSDNTSGSVLSANTCHVCPHCSGRFAVHSNLRLHLMFVHGEKLHSALPVVPTAGNGDAGGCGNQKKTKVEGGKGKADHNSMAEKKAEKTRTWKYVCEVCREDFSCAHELSSHKRTHVDHKPFVCDICSKAFAQSGHLRTHKLYHSGLKPFVCEVCSKAFTVAFQLKRHKLIHSSHKPFVCDVCGKAFPGPNGLKVHKLFHTDRKSFVCDVCSKAFVMVYDLKRHKKIHLREMRCKTAHHNTNFVPPRGLRDDVRAAHTGEKPYVCDVCGKSFSCPSKLTLHQRTHTGEKPFTCDICATSFSHSSTLKRHKKIHAHCDTDFVQLRCSQVHVRTTSCTHEKPYICDVCGASFSSPSKLQSHQRTHTGEKPFACDLCETSFSHSSSLKRHRRIHTGEKPYVCTKCGKSFAQSGGLTEHWRRHRGERPHACPHCPAAFVTSQLLKGHVKKEHQ